MPGDIPDARFRLPTTFAASPDLSVDEGPAQGLIIGQNSPGRQADAIYLGKHAETPYRNAWMDIRGAHVLYVMGKRRSGKSYTLGTIAEGLVSDGWVRQGTKAPAVLVLDTMNVFLTMPFAVAETFADSTQPRMELQKWRLDGASPSLALYAPHGTTMPQAVTSQPIRLRASDLGLEEWCGLFDVDAFVDPMGHLLGELLAKTGTDGYTDKTSGEHRPAEPHFDMEHLVHVLDADAHLDTFPRDSREALARRLESVRRSPLFGGDGLDVRQLLQPGRISVLLLRDLEQEMRAVMVAIIVKRMMQLRALSEQQERVIPIHKARAEKLQPTDPAAAAREIEAARECEERAATGLPRSWLIIDEAHNYVPSRSTVPSRRPLKKFVDEGRNLGLSIVVATQQPSGLDPSIQRNADMLLIHALSHRDDIAAAAGMVNTAFPEDVVVDGKHRFAGMNAFEALVRSLPIGYAIASTDRANRLFPVKIRPRVTVHGGAEY